MVTQGLKAVDELLFGTIAVREGYVSPTQVDECVKLQAERQGSTSSNTKLGLILVERAYMSNDQVAAILDIQKRHLKIIDADPHRGGLFGQLCLDNAFINEEKLQLCLKEQESLAKRGQPAMIGQIMLRRSIISTDQFLQVLKLQRRRVMRCPGCDTFYNIEDQPEGAKFICRRCGTIVAVQSPDRARAAGSPDTVTVLFGIHDSSACDTLSPAASSACFTACRSAGAVVITKTSSSRTKSSVPDLSSPASPASTNRSPSFPRALANRVPFGSAASSASAARRNRLICSAPAA